jgi:hypothetical protein
MPREVSRQRFVRGALGATAGVLLSACRTPASTGPAPTSSTTPRAPDWSALRAGIDGAVVLPADTDYSTAKAVFNSRFDDATPAAVVAVTSTDDVRRAVGFAATNGLKVAARSGGHSYIGASAADAAMVIDLRGLPAGIDYHDSTGLVTVSPAAQLDSVQKTLAANGRSIPSGSCPTVGVAGLTLGGGLGSDARRSGLTCDALASATVVLPSGDAVVASPDEHADLFWALRGGGGGARGVVTKLTFRTSPTTDRDVVTLVFPEDAIEQVIPGWDAWLTNAERAVWGMVNVTVGAQSRRCTVVLATPPGAGRTRADALGSTIGVRPVSLSTRTMNRADFIDFFEGGEQARRPRAFVAGSDVLGELTQAAAESIVAATSAWPKDAGSATVVLESLSGALRDVGPGETAFPWRRQAACLQWYTEPTSPPALASATRWLAGAHEAVQANSVGAYVNYPESAVPAARYFGNNLGRLAELEAKYDPQRLMYSGLTP